MRDILLQWLFAADKLTTISSFLSSQVDDHMHDSDSFLPAPVVTNQEDDVIPDLGDVEAGLLALDEAFSAGEVAASSETSLEVVELEAAEVAELEVQT